MSCKKHILQSLATGSQRISSKERASVLKHAIFWWSSKNPWSNSHIHELMHKQHQHHLQSQHLQLVSCTCVKDSIKYLFQNVWRTRVSQTWLQDSHVSWSWYIRWSVQYMFMIVKIWWSDSGRSQVLVERQWMTNAEWCGEPAKVRRSELGKFILVKSSNLKLIISKYTSVKSIQ